MNAKDLELGVQVLELMRKACANLEAVRNRSEGSNITLRYKHPSSGYTEQFNAQNIEVYKLAKAYFERHFQMHINDYARRLRSLGIEIPEGLNKHVTNYPVEG